MSTPFIPGTGGDPRLGAPPSPDEVDFLHRHAGTGVAQLHHRIGMGPTDAAPGDHTHDGKTSKRISYTDLTDLPAPPEPESGYRYLGRLMFTSSGTFNKGDYPGLRAVRLTAKGGGGGSGYAAATTGNNVSAAAGGAEGGRAEAWCLAEDLPDNLAITVGAGGLGALNNSTPSTAGGTSRAGTSPILVEATGGAGGDSMNPSANVSWGTTVAAGGVGTVGDLLLPGESGGVPIRLDGDSAKGGDGGGTGPYSSRAIATSNGNVAASIPGLPGIGFGGGAAGPCNGNNQTVTPGADGAPGVVILELFS